MLKIDIISVQPEMFRGFLEESIVARAVKKGACEINIVNLREYGVGRWKKVDDKPYGGGPGMLMMCAPWFQAVEACQTPSARVIMTAPAGQTFTQRTAEELAKEEHLVFLCGHYEGFDARIETLATDKLSIGDFVMTGGELAAASMVDAIVRLLPGVLGGGPQAVADESFSEEGLLEAPQYTHPPEFRGMKVPEVLLSGNHAKIEAWKKAARKLKTCLFAFFALCWSALASDVLVVAHEPGFYTSLAKHAQRWLAQEGVSADLVQAKDMAQPLAHAKAAFLIGFDSPSAQEMAQLTAFRKKGGRLVVFYSSSPQLAALMGVKVIGYAKAAYPGQWSQMNFAVKFPEGMPRTIRQTSTVLQRAVPIQGKGRVMAAWSDRTGKSTGDAAWISSASGYWMTHVLLADGDEKEKARLLAAMVGALIPGRWNAQAALAKEAAERQALRAYAKAQVPRKGEIHAVWDHSGCGLYPGNWTKTMKILQEARVTDLFVNVAGAGFAHYPSEVLPRSRTYEQEGDQLAACLKAAQGTGIRVHAWVLCFTATRGTPERLAALQKKGWCLKTRDGQTSEYLDPSKAAVQDYILKALEEIQANYNVQGIHLDFVRWYERSVRPKDAAEVISKFVAAARQRVKRPAWLTTAVLGKYPMCIASVGQDWDSWLRTGLVDYVVPMDYSEDLAQFESFLKQHAQIRSHANRTIVGIGVTANESRLSPRAVIEQLRLVRRYNLPGVALFDLDRTLETQILPYLKLGIW